MKVKYSYLHLDKAEYVQIAKNYYVLRADWNNIEPVEMHVEMCSCVAGRRKNLILTGQSACAVLGIPRLDAYDMRPHCITTKTKGSDIICWRHGKQESKSRLVRGMSVASTARVLCDLAKYDSRSSLLVSINHCLKNKLCTKEQIVAEIERRPGMRWKKILLRLLKYASNKCDSPLETLAFIEINKAGLIAPRQQVAIKNKKGFVGYVDMYWEIKYQKIILELDGAIKYTANKILYDEKLREDKLREMGFDVVRLGWKDVKNGRLIKVLTDYGIPKRRFRKFNLFGERIFPNAAY